MGYSIKQKMLILQKVLPPNNRPVHEVSKESGISVQTIYKWMQQVKEDTLEPGTPEDQAPRFKTELEKFSLLLESKAIPEDKQGEWLRKNGLHSEHLTLWEQELAKNMADKIDRKTIQQENQTLKDQLKKTTKEKKQLGKALAELSALYALKKKRKRFGGTKRTNSTSSRSSEGRMPY
jgi:transposase-like protein